MSSTSSSLLTSGNSPKASNRLCSECLAVGMLVQSTIGSSPWTWLHCQGRIKNTKVNSILYACQLGSLSDGILLDHPSSCIHRFELRTTRVEECKHKSTTTSCTREVCKKRKKKQGEDSRRPRKLRPTPQSFRPLELSASPTPTFANLLGIPKLARNFQPLPA